MGYEIRTLATLATQARQFFTQAVPGAIVRLWANTFTVFGKVFALLDFEHEQRRKWLFDQMFASTAEYLWLIRHGFELGVVPDAGDMAAGTISVPCAGMTASVPAGTTFQRADGATFATVASTPAPNASTINLVVQADLIGDAFNVDAGDTLQLIPQAGVPFQLGSTATVGPNGLSGGADAEDVETFRARVLYRKRNPPQGGSTPDYVKWAGEALATVKDVFPDSFANDSRSVWLCFTVSDQANGVPSTGQIAIVQAYVNDPVRRPITARVFATGPTPVAVPIQIANLSPDNADTRAAIAAEIAALQIDAMQPATPSTPFTLYVEEIDGAIKRAAGVQHFTRVAPAGDINFSTGGQLPSLQAPTYS